MHVDLQCEVDWNEFYFVFNKAELGVEEVANLGTCGDTQVARVVLPDGASGGIRYMYS